MRVFFFQAEDGIRDLTVTGVQTCALPISAGHDSTATARDEFCEKIAWLLGPEGLDVREPRSAHPDLVPSADIGEMDVTEHDSLDAFRRQGVERLAEGRLEPRPGRPALHEPYAHGLGLCGDE